VEKFGGFSDLLLFRGICVKSTIRVECPNCRHWNGLEVEKTFLQPDSPEPKVKVLIPSYISHKIQRCENCQTVIANPDELFRIINGGALRYKMKDVE
jgi:hypothetical protein